MTERDQMLIALVQEVLGPRGGPQEVLPIASDPRLEYITGVLEPAEAERPEDMIEEEVDEVIEETSSEEDQDTQGFVAAPGVFSPALDPKALPRSIGLSFTVETDGAPPQIEVCATWARYTPTQNGWQRSPASYLTGPVLADQTQQWQAGLGIRLQLRSTLPGSPATWRVSLFLVNETAVQNNHPTTMDYVFQPQIRVLCSPGTRLVPVRMALRGGTSPGTGSSMASEDASLGLLYQHRMALARGHMCGATWRDIDPERPHPVLQSPGVAPFVWADAGAVPAPDRGRFSPPDVRTEMVPCYPVQTPGMDWPAQYGGPPELDPAVLAETWDPTQLRAALQPLVDGYDAWIFAQQVLVPGLPSPLQNAASQHIQECQRAAARIRESIDILCAHDDARLAFCFANQAIYLQASWRKPGIPRPLVWRPFQLAFFLLNLPPLVDPAHPDRQTCDLLWFPTGGGKTEAYLAIAAFVLALRRLGARPGHGSRQGHSGAGVGVLSRYTLRLLTIQQFRRALGVITACELLRVQELGSARPVGWRPRTCPYPDSFLWGGSRFSAGLWVGGNVTPNGLHSIGPMPSPDGGMMMIAGALDILQGIQVGYSGPNQALANKARQVSRNLDAEGEPAQVTACPCCRATLAVPEEGLGQGSHTLHFVYHGGRPTSPMVSLLQHRQVQLTINGARVRSHRSAGFRTLSLNFTIPAGTQLKAEQVDEWWHQTLAPVLGNDVTLVAARPARPGYFLLRYETAQRNRHDCDFDIYCPNPDCDLNRHSWAERVPVARDATDASAQLTNQMQMNLPSGSGQLPDTLSDEMQWQVVPIAFEEDSSHRLANRVPIPALTVDDQLYHRCPSLVIATVDKFARLSYEPKAASLFGNVEYYHSRWGYYREGCPPSNDGGQQRGYIAHPTGHAGGRPLHVRAEPFRPPDLILQDELHLIEGPLGSMVGLYETAVDALCQQTINGGNVGPKYIASTATVRQAETQIRALFDRQLMQFPPAATSADERFFATDAEIHPLDSSRPGRLYAAVCAPGKGAQTPLVRIWASLLQQASDLRQVASVSAVDPFWTLVGYFNATRELAGALSLYRQDIPEWMNYRFGQGSARRLDDTHRIELSSRAKSTNLPSLLQRLEQGLPDAQDAAFATSMFGTGVDIDRLSLMVVHGQPKTTASYIQATGRVGRQTSALVVTFFRATRPRDLDHYEFFTGYHRALYRHVEPVTVAPFSPRARERALGPLAVALLRQGRVLNGNIVVDRNWRVQQRIGSAFFSHASWMATHRFDPEVVLLPDLFEARAGQQPAGRRPLPGITTQEADSEIDRWRSIANQHPGNNDFVYNEPALLRLPQRHVVLGDAQHHLRFDEAYENAPQSLREVEETTGFKV